MQHRMPRQSPRDQAAQATHDDPRLGTEAAAALAAARRRAVRDGDRQIDTAHLLHSLLENDPEVRAVFDGGPQLARLLGYLVQRSIGYGLRWQSGVEDSGALPVVTVVEGFSPLATTALEQACARAARREGAPARGVDLLMAIVADPQARAVEVLAHAGVDVHGLRARIEAGDEGGPDGCGDGGCAGDGLGGYEACVGGGETAS
ncbi:Clp amino terminal domain-containing protein, pathogenicity island component [Streptomyces sp. yr375]|uniref:Clp protease N-terminal domain-containing protein n=1 Tax=Streptomyces sp. yr375 TaxID=1761906 RepID=UPI0008D49205|nr:Clp protease N-terminal domain-containing protein [Streptomyces sp. yr375]SEP86777.1 Clp amino terminal domain-containing protein, pathogenicity island component [Streptomyces sp. yr375]